MPTLKNIEKRFIKASYRDGRGVRNENGQVIVRDAAGKVEFLTPTPLTKKIRPGDLVEGRVVKESHRYFWFKPRRITGRVTGLPARQCERVPGRVYLDGEGRYHVVLGGDPEKLKRFARKRVTVVFLW